MPRSPRVKPKNTAAAHREPRAAADRDSSAAAHRDASAAAHREAPAANLKDVAEFLGLSSATVSMVMNRSPAAKSIPQSTQDRVRAAARQLNYRPNFMAKSLRQKRSFTVGVIVPEISEGYGALVMSGIEDHLLQEGYFYYVVSHRHRKDLIEEYPRLLQLRSVEGLIAVDTPCQENKSLRIVAVSGHQHVPGVTNILLDHALAAKLALEHLYALGHRKIAFIKGQEFSSDTAVRWKTVQESAAQLGLKIDAALVAQLVGEVGTPELGYYATRRLLEARRPFTALFAFNDISAMGATRALGEAKLKIPEDVSVVGFDDIPSAAYQNPALTTVRQPLREMGVIAAETLLQRITSPANARFPDSIIVKPTLAVRASTGPVRRQA
ncbi:MAG: LacI family DNA-binding transcriptional regulator [Candidatus Acidiferrales bacterium]